jgi:C4-dicarboxylate-specific signal transduction histidine kinase
MTEAFAHRATLLGAAVVYPLWALGEAHYLPAAVPSLGPRLVLSFVFLMLWLGARRTDDSRRTVWWLFACGTLTLLHFLYLLHINGYTTYHVIGLFVVTAACGFAMPAVRPHVTFAVLTVVACLVLELFARNGYGVLLALSFATIGVFTSMAMFARERTVVALETSRVELEATGAEYERLYRSLRLEQEERQRAEEAAVQARANAELNMKLAALGEMAGGIAHEINNPLAVIDARARALGRAAGAAEIGEHAASIQTMVQRISRIIRGLLAFARDGGGEEPMVRESLADVLEETIGLCAERFKAHGVELRFVSAGVSCEVLCRRVQVSQMVLNLLNNAHDAVLGAPQAWVELVLEAREAHCRILVRDGGPGVPGPIRESIMQPFFTTKNVGQGTGLGLSIALGLAKDHGWVLRYDADAPVTTFVIEAPRVPAGAV